MMNVSLNNRCASVVVRTQEKLSFLSERGSAKLTSLCIGVHNFMNLSRLAVSTCTN